MMHATRILFVTMVVISMVYDVHVECKRKGGKLEMKEDTSGVTQIGKDDDKELTSKKSSDCFDCGTDDLDLKRGKGSKLGKRRNKKFTKDTPFFSSHSKSLSNHFSNFWKNDAPVTEHSENISKKTGNYEKQETATKPVLLSDSKAKSKSFTNYFSRFWKDKGLEKEKKKNNKEIPTNKGDKKKEKDRHLKKIKQKAKSQRKDEDKKSKKDGALKDIKSKEKGLQKFYSSFWDDEDEFEDSSKKASTKTIKTKSKDENTGKKSSPKKDKSVSSSRATKSSPQFDKSLKVEIQRNKGNTGNTEKIDNVHVDETSKEVKNQDKKKKSKKKKANKERNRKNKVEHLTSKDNDEKKDLKSKRKDKKKRLKYQGKDENGPTKSKNKDKEEHIRSKNKNEKNGLKSKKKDKKELIQSQTKDEKEYSKSKNKDKEEHLRSKDKDEKESSKYNNVKKNSNSEKTDLIKSDIIIDSESQSSEFEGEENVSKKTKEEEVKPKSKKVSRARKGRKRKKKTKLQKKANMKNEERDSEDKDASIDKPKKDKNINDTSINKKAKSSNDEELVENTKSTFTDFQGLKGKLNSKGKGNKKSRSGENSEQTSEATDKPDNELLTKSKAEVRKDLLQNRTKESQEERIVKETVEIKNSKDNIKESIKNGMGNTEKPETNVDIKTFAIKRLDTNSQKVNFDKMLLRAERVFQRKDKRIRRKLTVLNQTTKKRFNEFINVNQSHYNHASPYVTFNFSQANKQFGGSRISSIDLNKMIISLKPNSPKNNNFDKVTFKPQNSNTSISLGEENLLQGDDPNIKEISRHYLISKNKERKRLARKRKKNKIRKELEYLERKENAGIQYKRRKQGQILKKGDEGNILPERKVKKNKDLKERNGNDKTGKILNLDTAVTNQKLNKLKGKRKKRKHRNRSQRKLKNDGINSLSKSTVTVPLDKSKVAEKINDDEEVLIKEKKKKKKNRKKDKQVSKSKTRKRNDDPDSLSLDSSENEMGDVIVDDETEVLRKGKKKRKEKRKNKKSKSVTKAETRSRNEGPDSLSIDPYQKELADKMVNDDAKVLRKRKKNKKKNDKKDKEVTKSEARQRIDREDSLSNSAVSLLAFYLRGSEMANRWMHDDAKVLRKDKKKRKEKRKNKKSKSVTKAETRSRNEGPDSLSIDPYQNELADKMVNDDAKVLRKRKKNKKKNAKKKKEVTKSEARQRIDRVDSLSNSTVSLLAFYLRGSEMANRWMHDDAKVLRKGKKKRKEKRKNKKSKSVTKSETRSRNEGPDSQSIDPYQNELADKMVNDDAKVLRERTKKKRKKVKKSKQVTKFETGLRNDGADSLPTSTVSLQSLDPYKNEMSDKMMNDNAKKSRKKLRKQKKRKLMNKSQRKQQNDETDSNMMRSFNSPRSRKHTLQPKSADIVASKSKRTRRKKNKGKRRLKSKLVRTNFRTRPRSNSHRDHQALMSRPRYYIRDSYRYPSRLKLYHLKGSHKRVVQQVKHLKQKQTRGRSRSYRNRSKPQHRLQRLRPKTDDENYQKGEKSKQYLKNDRDLSGHNSEEEGLMNKEQRFRNKDRNYQRDRDPREDSSRGSHPSRRFGDRTRNYNYRKRGRGSRRFQNRDQSFDNEDDFYTGDSHDEDLVDEHGHSRNDQYSRRFDGQNNFRHVDDYSREDKGSSRYPVENDSIEDEYGSKKGKRERDWRRYDDFDDEDDGELLLSDSQEVFRDEDGDMDYPSHDESFEFEYIYPRRRERGPRRYRAKESRRYTTQSYRGRSNRQQKGTRHSSRYSYDDENAYYTRHPDSRHNDQGHDIVVGRYYYSRPIYKKHRGYGGDMDSRYDGYEDSSREEERASGGLQRSRSDRRRRHKSRTHSRKYGRDEYFTYDDDYVESDRESRREQNVHQRRKSNSNERVDSYREDRVDNGRGRSRQPYHDDRDMQRQARLQALEYQRKRQIQRVLPVLSQKYQRIKRELQGVLRHYTDAMQKSEQLYEGVFNGTRYDIMNGMGAIYEQLYSANDDIYDAVMRSSQTSRSIYKKALQDREAQLKGLPTVDSEPDLIEARSMVKGRNFRQNLLKARLENRNLAQESRNLKMLTMRCMQGKARLQQVKEHLKERYDHQTVIDLFNNMRSSIYYLNEGLAVSYGLGQLRRDKMYITFVKGEVDAAKSDIKSSKEAVRIGFRKYMENNNRFLKWEREQKMRQRNRAQRDGPGSSLNPYQVNQLKQFTSKCKRHSMELKRTAHFIQGTLQRPIQIAKRALQRQGKGVTVSHLNLYIPKLRGDVKDMFVALDDLRMYVEKQPMVVPSKRCKELIEGSGSDVENENNDDDLECIEEESEGATHENLIEGGNEDDFTFEDTREEKPNLILPNNPMRAFGIKLSELSTQVLRKSENMHESVQLVIRANDGLEHQLQAMRSNTSVMDKHFTIRKDIRANLITLKTDRQETFSRLQQISLKMEKLNEIDFDELQSKAIEAIKIAKGKLDDKDVVITTGEKDKSTEKKDNEKKDEEKGTDLTSSNKGNNLTETKVEKEDDIDYSGLLKKGADIQSNTEDIKHLQSLAVNAYTKSCSKMSKMHTNISTLMQKVEQARNILTSLQLSVSKDGDSPIPVTIPSSQADISNSLITTMSICIKPKTLDGTVLYVQGNQSASYTITLADGELSATVYDAENDDLETLTMDEDLQENQWYTIRMIRAGQMLNMTVKGQDEEIQQGSIQIDKMPFFQPPSVKSFIGGVPKNAEISGDPWQGCVGELILNGRSLSVFQLALDGQQPSLCSDHCISQDKKLSWSFDGDGYVYYSRPPLETIESVSIYFKTMQSTGSILSATNRRKRLNLLVSLDKGAVKVETSNGVENAVLLSINGSLNDGKMHALKIKYIEGKTYPELDGDNSAFSVERSRPKLYRHIKNGILLGSFVSDDGEYLHQRNRPLIGCVGKLAINENPILSADATEVYHAYHGQCNMKTVWQTCTQLTATSVPLSLGIVENSNIISLLVDRNASGPLLLYDKKDSFKMLIDITNTTVNILGKDSESALVKTESTDDSVFTLLTVKDDGSSVVVSAYGQSSSISYGSWWTASDTDSPHTIALGQPREDGKQTFTGSISQLVIGERLYDLTMHLVPNKFETCRRPLRPIMQNGIHEVEDNNFCS